MDASKTQITDLDELPVDFRKQHPEKMLLKNRKKTYQLKDLQKRTPSKQC